MLSERTRRKKRISCVKDVLARLRYRNVKEGCYLDLRELEDNIELNNKYPNDKQIRAVEKCPACAIGNLFLSHLRLHKKITNKNLSSCAYRYRQCRYLLEYFDKDQLELIENAFELYGDVFEDTKGAAVFGKQYDDPKERLKAICKNIIKNKGTFKCA